MFTKTYKVIGFLALSGLFCAFPLSGDPPRAEILFVSSSAYAAQNATETTDITQVSDNVAPTANSLPAGFYQFNKLEILKGPIVDEPPATIEVIQKNNDSCFVYENGKTDKSLPCIFNGNQDNNYVVQIEERTTLLGINQEPALLIDFQAGDKINVLGWLSADSKTIRAAVVRNLEEKDYHQSLSGTIKKVNGNGFTITLTNGDEIFIETPIVEGAQVTVKGVFDKVKNAVSNVLSIFIKPTIVLQEKPTEEPTPPPPSTPSAKPSTLFKNFLKIFGL